MFAAKGHDAPLQEVVRESGLGRGTLYRHFPDRQALIIAVFEVEIGHILADVEQRAGDPALFMDFLESQSRAASVHIPVLCAMDEDRLGPFFERMGPLFDRILASVVATARGARQVREDFDAEDLRLVIEMLSMARASKTRAETVSYERAVELILQGISPTE